MVHAWLIHLRFLGSGKPPHWAARHPHGQARPGKGFCVHSEAAGELPAGGILLQCSSCVCDLGLESGLIRPQWKL